MRPVVSLELRENRLHVSLYRVFGDVQVIGNNLVRAAGCDMSKHLNLSFG